MTLLSDTIADLQALTEPSREMDARILLEIGGERRGEHWREPWNSFWSLTPPAYTASIDAAIALAERVLPDKPEMSFQGGIWVVEYFRVSTEITGAHQSLAIAILIATLTALDKEG